MSKVASSVESFEIAPSELVMDPLKRGRWKPPTAEQAEEVYRSLKEGRQIEPIGVVPVGETYEVVFGFTRTEQMLRINEELKAAGKPERLIRCEVVVGDPKDIFLANVDENNARVSLTDVDRLHITQNAKKSGLKQKDIAKMFGKSEAWVTQLLKLQKLEEKHLQLIHDGRLTRDGGEKLVQIKAADRDRALEMALREDGSYDTLVIIQCLRPVDDDAGGGSEGGDEGGEGEGGSKEGNGASSANLSRTLKQVKTYFSDMIGAEDADGWRIEIRKIAESIVDYCEGRMTDKTFSKRWLALEKALAPAVTEDAE